MKGSTQEAAGATWTLVRDGLTPAQGYALARSLEKQGYTAKYVQGGGVAVRAADAELARHLIKLSEEFASWRLGRHAPGRSR